MITVRSKSANGRTLFANDLKNFNWSPLSTMQDCHSMLTFFNNTITDMLGQHLPLYTVKRLSTDKPWVDDAFRRLIQCRQYAFRHGNLEAYRSYRNKVQRSAKVLRRKYYEHRLADLRCVIPRNWWMKVEAITGISSLSEGALDGLSNDRCSSSSSIKCRTGDMDPQW